MRVWLTAPVATVFRPTPPAPIVTVSVPVLPAMEMPENDLILFRLTEIVSAAEFTVRPGIGAALVSVPADRAAVIVRTLDAALYAVCRSVIATPAGSSASTTWLPTRLATTSSAASIARDSSPPKPSRLTEDDPLRRRLNVAENA